MLWPNRFFVAAISCALVPLAAGIAVMLLWCLNDWDWLIKAGMLTILGGIVAVLVGCLLLLVSAIWSVRRVSLLRLAGRIGLALVLLGVNLPLDYLVAKTAAHAPKKRAKLFVANDGPDIEDFVLCGACLTTDFGAVRAGDFSQRKFAIKRDGRLEFQATREGRPIGGVLAERVTPADEPDLELTFNPDGSWGVESLRRR
jgi:hypothetical protein